MRKFISVLKWTAIILISLLAIAFIYISINKQEIIAGVKKDIELKIKGHVEYSEIALSFFKSFPVFSVELTNVSVTDSLFSVHHNKLFTAKEVLLKLNIINKIFGKPAVDAVSVKHGSLYLYSLPGNENGSIVKSKSKNIEIKKISIEDFRVAIDKPEKNKFYDFSIKELKIKFKNDGDINVNSNLLVNAMIFNKEKGSYLKNKQIKGSYLLNYRKGILSFDNVKLFIDNHPFVFSGNFNSNDFKLAVFSANNNFKFLSSVLTPKIDSALNIVSLNSPVNVWANISGPIKSGDPLVTVKCVAKNVGLKTNFMDFDKAAFTAFFTNENIKGLPRKDPNSKITIRNFSALWHDIPVSSQSIEIADLKNPVLSGAINSEFKIKDLDKIIGSESLEFKNGSGKIYLNYKGPFIRNDSTNSFINGNVSITDGNVRYKPRSVDMENIDALIIFKNSNVFIEKLNTIVLKQKIFMKGEGKSLLSLINTNPGKATINWNIFSPLLNMNNFSFLLSERSENTVKKKGLLPNANKLDELLKNAILNVNFQTPALIYKNFKATKVDANVTLLADSYSINDLSMLNSGGSIKLHGKVFQNTSNSHKFSLAGKFSNVEVSNVFNEFDNFGQSGIEGKNLKGNLTTNFSLSGNLSNKGFILPKSITGVIDFSLKNGELLNYEPVKKIQKFIFKNRNFDTISFAELKNKIEFKGGEYSIKKMEIQSSVLTLIVQGLYSTTGNSDISIQVPLNNLKKRDDDYIPKNIGINKKFGTSIFLRGKTGSDGNINFKLDLFNKYKKEH